MAALVDFHPSDRRGPAIKTLMRNVVLAGAKSRQAKSVHAPPEVEADGRRWSGVRRSGGGGGDGKCEISLVPFFPSVDAGGSGKAGKRCYQAGGRQERGYPRARLPRECRRHGAGWRRFLSLRNETQDLPRMTSCCTGSFGFCRCRLALDDLVLDIVKDEGDKNRDGLLECALYSSALESVLERRGADRRGGVDSVY